MRFGRMVAAVAIVSAFLFLSLIAEAQQTGVPRMVPFTGTLQDSAGTPLSGVHGVTFALYREREGGAPLWVETQNVLVDEQGRYTALLGALTQGGLPLDLFTS